MALAGIGLGAVGTVAVTAGMAYLGWLGTRTAKDLAERIEAAGPKGEIKADADRAGKVILAAHNYESSMGTLPNPYHRQPPPWGGGVPGQPRQPPLLSWRVDLLPYLSEDGLYKQFQLQQPWDAAANRPLAQRRVDPLVAGYDPPGSADTRWRGFTGPNTVFPNGSRIPLVSVADGTSNTLLFVEAAEPVTWTEPNDYPYLSEQLAKALPRKKGEAPPPSLPTAFGRPGADGFLVAMMDGSVRYVKKGIDPLTLRRLIEKDDGYVIPPGWDDPPADAPAGINAPPKPVGGGTVTKK
jgi:hypothetical protein